MTLLPTVRSSGEFRLFGVTLHCHVLDDGQRIIEADDVERLFDAMAECEPVSCVEEDLRAFAKWMRGLEGGAA